MKKSSQCINLDMGKVVFNVMDIRNQFQCGNGQQHILFFGLRESYPSLLKTSATETTRPQNWILANGATTIETMMGFGWGNVHISMACYVLDCLGLIPFITLGMLYICCSGHLFPSFKCACCLWLFWASFPFMTLGVLDFGELWHLSFSSNGQGAFWLFWVFFPS